MAFDTLMGEATACSNIDQTIFFEDIHLGCGLVNKRCQNYFVPKKWQIITGNYVCKQGSNTSIKALSPNGGRMLRTNMGCHAFPPILALDFLHVENRSQAVRMAHYSI
jgi:hypothetical protein